MIGQSGRRIGLVTCSGVADLSRGDKLLRETLERRGHEALPRVWDDPTVDWASFDVCVIRSTWDYFHHLDAFLAWAERASTLTRLWNPPEVLRWNTHKGYLRDLEEHGVPVVPTLWIDRGEHVDLRALLASRGWERAVVKPAVSANAFGTALVALDRLEEGQQHLDERLAAGDVLVQPFMSAVETTQERSLLFVDGEFTHAVLRQPQLRTMEMDIAAGDSDEYAAVTPTPEELALAGRALQATEYSDLLYARVDMVQDEEGAFRLMELELVEPYLFLENSPHAVERLAEGIITRSAAR